MKKETAYRKPVFLAYYFLHAISLLFSRLVFRPKILRNEIRKKKGAYVLLGNHECALDAVMTPLLIRRRMTFVISRSFYETLPFQKLFGGLRPIVKNQFQTSLADMFRMKNVIAAGAPLVLYPAGLMPDNGVATPIPAATYRFLQWLGADVYVTRVTGTYFVNPKWSKKMRPGRTTIDTYKLFDKSELAALSLEDIQKKVDAALLFNAYEEQEKLRIPYRHGDLTAGLERVLYRCPECKKEGTIRTEGTAIFCSSCGYRESADRYGFLHAADGCREIRRPDEWDAEIDEALQQEVRSTDDYRLSSAVRIDKIDPKKHRYRPVGEGTLTLDCRNLTLVGTIGGEPFSQALPIREIAALPSSPKRNCVELQYHDDIFRCTMQNDGDFAIKYRHLLKIFYDIHHENTTGSLETRKEE